MRDKIQNLCTSLLVDKSDWRIVSAYSGLCVAYTKIIHVFHTDLELHFWKKFMYDHSTEYETEVQYKDSTLELDKEEKKEIEKQIRALLEYEESKEKQDKKSQQEHLYHMFPDVYRDRS